MHWKLLISEPYLNVLVDLGVEEDEHGDGDDAEDGEPGPVVVVGGVVGVHAEVGHVEHGPGDVGGGAGGLVALLVRVPRDLGLEELGHVEQDREEHHREHVLRHPPQARALVVHRLKGKKVFGYFLELISLKGL